MVRALRPAPGRRPAGGYNFMAAPCRRSGPGSGPPGPGHQVLIDGWDHGHRMVDAAALDGPHQRTGAGTGRKRGVARATVCCGVPGPRSPPSRRFSAVLRSGAVLVPLSPSATAAEIDHVIGDARPVLALCRPSAGPRRSPAVRSVMQHRRARPPRRGRGPRRPPRPAGPSDDALIVYTSGTTGQAEGRRAHARLAAGRRRVRC